jgi:hypothetical protein
MQTVNYPTPTNLSLSQLFIFYQFKIIMKSHSASLINAIILILLGTWGYFASDNPSATSFIPVGIGIILLFFNGGIRTGNKIMGHIAAILTLLVLIGLLKPLIGSYQREDSMAIFRVGIMLLSTLFTLTIFFREFLQLRKERK